MSRYNSCCANCEVYVLSKVERRQNGHKLGGEVVGRVIHVCVEVAGDEESMRCGCSGGEKRCDFIQKGRERFRKRGGYGRRR